MITWFEFKHAVSDFRYRHVHSHGWHDYPYAHSGPLYAIELWLRRRTCCKSGHRYYSAPWSWKNWCAVCFDPTPEHIVKQREAEYAHFAAQQAAP